MDTRLAFLVALSLFALPAGAETLFVEAGRDATVIEDPDGGRANGSGPTLFAGRTSQTQNGIRRGLVYFDVAAALPPNAIVRSAAEAEAAAGRIGYPLVVRPSYVRGGRAMEIVYKPDELRTYTFRFRVRRVLPR